ncbi:hypothetical protein N431DRAFT_157948 [Stipitochalara longipes BDJ]|nr:hypothetical protein N431DRAFT_157948 [Stipitochalara longipes BDJ]
MWQRHPKGQRDKCQIRCEVENITKLRYLNFISYCCYVFHLRFHYIYIQKWQIPSGYRRLYFEMGDVAVLSSTELRYSLLRRLSSKSSAPCSKVHNVSAGNKEHTSYSQYRSRVP